MQEIEIFPCTHCAYKTARKKHLYLHVQQMHIQLYKGTHFDLETSRNYPLKHHSDKHVSTFVKPDTHILKNQRKTILEEHPTSHQESGQWLQCEQCLYKCRAPSCMRKHKHNIHAGKNSNLQYRIVDRCSEYAKTEWLHCGQCDFKVYSEDLLQRHVLVEHQSEKKQLFNCLENDIEMYTCHKCGYFKTSFLAHLRRHIAEDYKGQNPNEVQYKCDKCSFITYSKYLHIRHGLFDSCISKGGESIKFEEKQLQLINEDVKTEQAQTKTDFNKKFKSHHSDCYRCTQCSFQTTVRSNLVKHSQKHRSGLLNCDMCNFRTKYHANLQHHKELKHSISGRAKSTIYCEYCPYFTDNPRYLRRHQQRQHENVENIKPSQKGKIQKAEKYHCQYCSFKSVRRNTLNDHILTHTNPENINWFFCGHCDYKAKRKNSLHRHITERHLQQWVYCALCEYQATSKRLLITHFQRMHRLTKEDKGEE